MRLEAGNLFGLSGLEEIAQIATTDSKDCIAKVTPGGDQENAKAL
jgi:hypothetical protein